jgi:hypothetical protein
MLVSIVDDATPRVFVLLNPQNLRRTESNESFHKRLLCTVLYYKLCAGVRSGGAVVMG